MPILLLSRDLPRKFCHIIQAVLQQMPMQLIGCPSSAVSSVEDPEKMLEQTVNEMQSDLIKMRQASAQVWNKVARKLL